MDAHVTTLDRPSDAAQAQALREALRREGFSGDVEDGIGPRLVAATDNSIYQVMPVAVLHPRRAADVAAAVRAARAVPDLALSPRGGGTGTNGQSLTRGAVLDLSRHLNRILDLDIAGARVVVEPGVVLDQLNAFLKPHGFFFPPAVSTASRATLGGMIATDASGKGSRRYGRTSDHVASLDVVLSDGSDFTVRPLARADLDATIARGGLVGEIHAEVLRVVTQHAELIAETFPDMNRGLTGYNLQGVTRPDGTYDLVRLLAGSEGTLAFTRSATLRITPLPKHRLLMVARYGSFDTALRDVRHLLAADPLAIEILDDKTLELASRDVIWSGLEAVLGGPATAPVRGLNVVEFAGDDPDALGRDAERCAALLADSPHPALDWVRVDDPAAVAQVWTMREKAVGLMGRLGEIEGSRRQGTAFVEDTAVPPERLADYVAEFRAVLDRHGLGYGMYGHADVGCLHVRPSLDMADPAEERMIRVVSDEVAALVKRYGGLIWGEHGRGYRGEFSPLFFGPVLYGELCRIKRAFDPENLFNPGKLASPDLGGPIDRIDAVPTRGSFDRLIDEDQRRGLGRAVSCNGNAACHSWDAFDAMCPSYHATRDRVQSPKGRATLLRAWMRLRSEAARGCDVAAELAAVEADTNASMDTCLSCKACASLCPVKVDIPSMRSRFLASYYAARPRPWRDRLLRHLEMGLALVRGAPRLAGAAMGSATVSRLMRDRFGLVDLPRPAPTRWSPRAGGEGPRVMLLRDSFLGTFDGAVIDAAGPLLERLGYRVTLSAIRPNGKALHVLGLEKAFARIARRAVAERARLAVEGVPLVSLDAATGLLHESEYREYAEYSALQPLAPVVSIDRFLADEVAAGRIAARPRGAGPALDVLLHCTEKTAEPETAARWGQVMAHLGLDARFPKVGCCGMAGLFGHQAEQAELSRRIFDLGWRPRLGTDPSQILATGFSCRCQTERFAGVRPRHPVEAILGHLERCRAMRGDPRSHGLWERSAPPAPETGPLAGDIEADVAIVGGGYTGLSAALHLAEGGARVALLEGVEIGFGGSGRNVGLVNAGLWIMPEDVPSLLGPLHGERLLAELGDAPGLVFDTVERHGIPCEATRAGTLHCAVGARGLDEVAERARQWRARGAPVDLLDARGAAHAVGTSAYAGALLDRRAGTVQPLAYARGLAHAAARAGARLFTASPVSAVEDEGTGWRLRTAAGSLRAPKIIVATNAYTGDLWPEVRAELVHLPYFNLATPPLSSNLAGSILPGRQGVWDTREVLSSFRLDAAGRLVFGSVGALRGTGRAVHRAWGRRALAKLFPQLAGIGFEHEWFGAIGMTSDAVPRFHRLGRGVVGFSGYNGRGIAPGTAFGRCLARLMLGEIGEADLPLPVTDPAPVRFRAAKEAWYEVGAQLVHVAGARG